MRQTLNIALIALGLVGGSLASIAPTLAEEHSVGVQIGHHGIAFGYSDGYWDRDHAWHEWRDRDEAARFREENREHYYEWKHDRDRDEGWREHDRWWDRH